MVCPFLLFLATSSFYSLHLLLFNYSPFAASSIQPVVFLHSVSMFSSVSTCCTDLNYFDKGFNTVILQIYFKCLFIRLNTRFLSLPLSKYDDLSNDLNICPHLCTHGHLEFAGLFYYLPERNQKGFLLSLTLQVHSLTSFT